MREGGEESEKKIERIELIHVRLVVERLIDGIGGDRESLEAVTCEGGEEGCKGRHLVDGVVEGNAEMQQVLDLAREERQRRLYRREGGVQSQATCGVPGTSDVGCRLLHRAELHHQLRLLQRLVELVGFRPGCEDVLPPRRPSDHQLEMLHSRPALEHCSEILSVLEAVEVERDDFDARTDTNQRFLPVARVITTRLCVADEAFDERPDASQTLDMFRDMRLGMEGAKKGDGLRPVVVVKPERVAV